MKENDDNKNWKDSTKDIVSKVAYLIGVPKRIFENEHEPPRLEIYTELDRLTGAKIVRELCRIRTAIERNFSSINQKMQREFRSILTMPEYVPSDAILYLAGEGITLVKKNNRTLVDIVCDINRHLCDRINNCAGIFPIWLNWQYIRELFIMPGGLSADGTKKAAEQYYANRMKYPYQVYINWIPEDAGNILYNDKKFCTLLYKMNGDLFDDISRVTDAGERVKNNIYDFINSSAKTVIVVDCENSDPYKMTATLNNLDAAAIGKISKIFLYNDIHASTAWRLFESYCKTIPVEHIMTERVKESKSLVDIKLSMGVSREFYVNGVDSFIIASSDSDYWALIESLPDARFLEMVEYEKCGPDIKAALESHHIFYCYIDDFCTGNSNEIKIAALVAETKRYLAEKVQLNVEVMLDEVYKNTRVHMTDAECTQFYQKYIRPMHLVIEKNGDVTIELRGR
ncbi:MAG: NYN domain-containing protein [Ruminococcaceae bacterium]|nr:NYN domain-containing protein [Oscillospiraceae bacterium]